MRLLNVQFWLANLVWCINIVVEGFRYYIYLIFNFF